jgi:hypothetical protein
MIAKLKKHLLIAWLQTQRDWHQMLGHKADATSIRRSLGQLQRKRLGTSTKNQSNSGPSVGANQSEVVS